MAKAAGKKATTSKKTKPRKAQPRKAEPRKAESKESTESAESTESVAAKPSKHPAYDRDAALDDYQKMLLIRRFEEKAGQLYGMGLIGGFCHLYIGQEAVVVGIQSQLRPDDMVITGYRDHGHMLACGMDAKGVMAELTGREGGYSKGKGGSMHMFSREKQFYGGHGIVAAQVPLGAGLAFSAKYRKQSSVATIYLGDGALNQGQVYESFNMAALWQLPAIFIIENNRYAMGTSTERGAAGATELYNRGQAYDIPGEQVDGMNVAAVRKAAGQAVAHCRAGRGPYILEMMTYRYRGHSMSDPAKYRTRDEVQEMRKLHDPIDRLREYMLEAGYLNEAGFKAIDSSVKAVVNEATEFAKTSPEPDEAELWRDVTIEPEEARV